MSSILRLSEAVALAIHSCQMIAASGKTKIPASEMAEKLKGSEAHLAKVLQRLVKAGIINSVRGPGGGFTLAKKPEDISLLDIYEVVEGSFPLGSCLFDKPACEDEESCPIHGILSKVNKDVYGYFAKTTLAALI